MNARLLPAVLLVVAPLLAQPPATPKPQPLTLEQTVPGRPGAVLFYSGVPSLDWATDGKHLVIEQGDKTLWVDPTDSTAALAPPDPNEARRADLVRALTALPNVKDERRASGLARRAEPQGGDLEWLAIDDDLYVQSAQGQAKRLTDDGKPKRETELSPDGHWLAYEQSGNLWVVGTDAGKARAITTDGSDTILNGRLDWVYQEEVYERYHFKGFWWSPSGEALIYYRLDESPVGVMPVVDHVPDPDLNQDHYVDVDHEHYPKVGTPNPGVSMWIAQAAGGEPVKVDLSSYPDDVLVVRAGWSPDGSKAVVQVQNRIETWLDLLYVDPKTGKTTRILREEATPELGWVNILGEPRWLEDGTFLWLSDRSGFTHIYHYRPDGELIDQVTSGDWVVEEIVRVDSDRVWFKGTKDGAVDSNLYRVGLDGKDLTRLTPGDGVHEVTLNGDGSLFLDEFSNLHTPPELRVVDADGKVVLTLQKGVVPATAEYAFHEHELLQIPARDGFLMDATLLAPVDVEKGKSYPILLDIYCGPNLRTVMNEWNRGADAFHQFLAEHGVAVLQVNNRTASGKGQKYTAQCYKHFGRSELNDLIDAIDWVGQHYDWADTKRVGITGWSYGGSMTAYALTHSDRFALGLAGAGVYDWRLYDTIYTERYMQTPTLNREGYDDSSVIKAAGNLHGHLLLVHGTTDDNVHLQNTIQLIYALQRADKDFDLMLYPKSQHGVRDGEQRWAMRRLFWKEIQEHLLGVAPGADVQQGDAMPAGAGSGPRVR